MFQVCPRIVPEILKVINKWGVIGGAGDKKKKVASPYMETVEWLLEM